MVKLTTTVRLNKIELGFLLAAIEVYHREDPKEPRLVKELFLKLVRAEAKVTP